MKVRCRSRSEKPGVGYLPKLDVYRGEGGCGANFWRTTVLRGAKRKKKKKNSYNDNVSETVKKLRGQTGLEGGVS